MWDTWVLSLGWEDPPEEGMATHSGILAWRIPRSLAGYSPWGPKELDTTEQLSTAQSLSTILCWLQMCNKVIQLYIYLFLFKFFSHLDYYKILSRVPRAIQQVLVGYLF